MSELRAGIATTSLDFIEEMWTVSSTDASDKSEQGQECAISHPLPVNPDGTPMSESQYKAFKGITEEAGAESGAGGGGKKGGRRKSGQSKVKLEEMHDDGEGEGEGEGELSDYGGMSEYDVAG